MIRAIDLDSTCKDLYVNSQGHPLIYFPYINHINILVGENNSGKSRFCRLLMNSKNATVLSDNIGLVNTQRYNDISRRLKRCFTRLSSEVSEIRVSINHDELTPCELYSYYYYQYEINRIEKRNFSYPLNNERGQIKNDLDSLFKMLTHTADGETRYVKFLSKVYIPVLRGIESFNIYFNVKSNQLLDSLSMTKAQREALDDYKHNAERIYKNKICSAYKMDPEVVFTGEDLYSEIRDRLLGKEIDRELIKNFEQFISANFFDNEGFTIIPLINKGYLNVKIGKKAERPLYDLGDGIKQLICILYKAYEFKDQEAIICIEEPEINLHPGYQRRLLEILQHDEFSKLRFIITTHSNHIVDSCLEYEDISIYKFKSMGGTDEKFQVEFASPGDIDILERLGVNNSSVFMANSTIWVEGLSDKIYLNKYLQVYMSEKKLHVFKEGIDYSFVEYGGNNVTHWSFDNSDVDDAISAAGITNRVFLVADNDNDKKIERKEKLRQIFGKNFYELNVREIENTISKRVLEKTLFDGKPVYKIGMEEKKDSYETKSARIWKYIDEHYQYKKSFWDSNKKCLKGNKIAFAKDVCSRISSLEDLSDNAIDICEAIYEFISSVSSNINS